MKTLLNRKNIPLKSILFFQSDLEPLDLSPCCVELRKLMTNNWAFVLMEKYQSKGYLGSYHVQQWSFQKEGNEILVRCYNDQEVIIMEMLLDIGSHHHKNFTDFKAYIVDNKCILFKEYQDRRNRQASA